MYWKNKNHIKIANWQGNWRIRTSDRRKNDDSHEKRYTHQSRDERYNENDLNWI
jgi:hypothetical protein